MAVQEFTVLFTHQKTKKAKVWQDGILKILAGGNQASLWNDKGQRLDNVFIKTGKVNIGDDLESDRYLITIEAEGASTNTTESNTERKDVPMSNRYGLKSAGLRLPAGLKRKFTGFQCPREVTKKPCLEVEESGRTSQLVQGCTSLSSELFTTSPLFAASFTKKADTVGAVQWQNSYHPDDRSYTCEKQSSVTCGNPQMNGNKPTSHFSSIKNQGPERENIAAINVLEDENRTKQSLRSTAQILALLKSQPSKEGTLTNLVDQAPVKPDKELLGPAFAGSPLLKRENVCQEPSPVKLHPVKSRWDVYLDQPSVSRTDYSDDNDTFVLSGSPDGLLSGSPDELPNKNLVNCFQNDRIKQEDLKGENGRTSEAVKAHMNGPKLNDLEHVSRLSNQELYNANKYCKNDLHQSALRQVESLSPVPCSSLNPAKLGLDDGGLENENIITEVSFNLMDSFDFADLDDGDSNVNPPLSQNSLGSAENIDTHQENYILLGKIQEKHSENKSLFKPDTVKSVLADDDKKEMNCTISILPIAESTTDDLASSIELPESDVCDHHKGEIKSEGEKLSALFESRSMSVLYNKEDISCRQFALKSADALQQEGLSSDDDTSGISLTQDFPKGVQCDEEDSPGLPQSGSSISVLKTLTKPCSALESLNAIKLKSFSTPEKRDCESGTCLQSGAQEVLHRTRNLAMKLPTCEDVPVQFFTVPVLSTFSPVYEEDDAQTLCFPQSTSPPLNSPIIALDENDFDYSGPSQTAMAHIMTPPESNSFSSVQCSLPQWIVGTPGSDCDWEFSQWIDSKVKTPTQEQSDNLTRQFFLRPRQCVSVESPGAQLMDRSAFLEQHNFVNSEKLSKLRSRLQMQVPQIIQPETVVSPSLDPMHGEYDVPEIQKQYRSLIKTNSYSFQEKQSTIVDDKGQGGNYLSRCLGTGPTLLGPPKSFPEPSSNQPSKWLKYQDVSSEKSQKNNCEENTEFCAQSVFRHPEKIEGIQNDDTELAQEQQNGLLKQRPGCQNAAVSRVERITNVLTTASGSVPHMKRKNLVFHDTGDEQISLPCDLAFPPKHIVLSALVPKRKVNIPAVFQSSAHYKQVFSASLTEHLNVIMFELSQRLHKALSKVDISFYTSSVIDEINRKETVSPVCLHQQPAKLVMVRKEGPNKGRFFYTCDYPKADQCKYFKWLDEVKGTHKEKGKIESRLVLGDMKSLSKFIRCQHINLYEESQLIIRKISGYQKRQFGKFSKVVNADYGGELKTKLYLKLNRKDNSSAYNKDDVWVVSKTLNFDPVDTFIACSVFYGPSANNDIEISPLKGYCPSNWPANMIVHALLVCNASTELTCMRNIQEHFNSSTLPLLPQLLTMSSECEKPKISRGKFKPPAITAKISNKCEIPDHNFVMSLAKDMIKHFFLNEDQAAALMQIALMMCGSDGPQKQQNPPITIIHGVFGAGKSYLLAVVVLFLVQLFETYDPSEEQGSSHWKLLISSSTNVAVDRVLLGLLNLGFEQFIRVGSVRKIAKPILPHSLHAGSENENEQLKELLALLKEDLTPVEKMYVRKSIEQHKLGTNKTLLGQVRVVGATCAACPFACLSNLKFPVVVLDECSQMTEPASLLPIARFQCEKLILVGDPKQLSPTIQGSEAAHEEGGLEQTLFDRLCLMGHQAIMLRTQYRCHPVISSVANELFYEGHLFNGVSEEDCKPLLDWLPTLCFYNANGTEQVEGNNSFYNMEEANFTVKLIQSLIASGIQSSMIGVITLYKSQMTKICSLLSGMFYCDPLEMKAIQVSTVDAFQGAEKEIIILSCVRTRQVGFIDSEKRMNVALTRGKRHLLIVGNLACLRKNKLWEQVIHHCERQNNGLKHVSQWDEKLSGILKLYQEKQEELSNMQTKHPKAKAGKVKASLPN
ncbi:protein ZGRF1 isoform X2 [Rana temporaria]|uniref:protein ZGRF1 isoform X2 n=1 Tax=Rana temporaria TaxID=8407 RepID=UPI001AAC4723|nr:protein ZGRF1 isoform X2 [Rana temporaria]